MGGGDIFALLAMLGSTVAGIAFLEWHLRNAIRAEHDPQPFGDVVNLPAEAKARAAKASPGERADKAARAHTLNSDVRTHHEGSL